ncbi:MAG: hypothetical protein Q9166_003845 [cf. Caloplaca sp. 2 TL-2023]
MATMAERETTYSFSTFTLTITLYLLRPLAFERLRSCLTGARHSAASRSADSITPDRCVYYVDNRADLQSGIAGDLLWGKNQLYWGDVFSILTGLAQWTFERERSGEKGVQFSFTVCEGGKNRRGELATGHLTRKIPYIEPGKDVEVQYDAFETLLGIKRPEPPMAELDDPVQADLSPPKAFFYHQGLDVTGPHGNERAAATIKYASLQEKDMTASHPINDVPNYFIIDVRFNFSRPLAFNTFRDCITNVNEQIRGHYRRALTPNTHMIFLDHKNGLQLGIVGGLLAGYSLLWAHVEAVLIHLKARFDKLELRGAETGGECSFLFGDRRSGAFARGYLRRIKSEDLGRDREGYEFLDNITFPRLTLG